MYKYLNNSSIQIAASPKDNLLYTIINEMRDPLLPVEKDIFQNNAREKFSFARDRSGKVNAFRIGDQSFSLVRKMPANIQMWYARPPANSKKFANKKTLRVKLNDGIDVGGVGPSGLDKKEMQVMINNVIDGTYKDVHSILLLRNNRLVVEEYFYEYDRNVLHPLRSVTRSFISALTGIAMGKGIIKSIDEPVISFFPEYNFGNSADIKKQITIRHLLTNQSGLDCKPGNEISSGFDLDMLNSDDWVKYTLEQTMTETPGIKGANCPGNAIVLGRILEKASGLSLDEFAKINLFKPMGISQFKWKFKPDRSSAGTYCQLYLKPRDIAKFGMLFLNNGKWDDKQIVPPGWIKESLAKHSLVDETDYGYLWWLKWIDAAGQRFEGYSSTGFGGQHIYLFPKYNFVAVITGGNYNKQSPADIMLATHVLPYLKEEDNINAKIATSTTKN